MRTLIHNLRNVPSIFFFSGHCKKTNVAFCGKMCELAAGDQICTETVQVLHHYSCYSRYSRGVCVEDGRIRNISMVEVAKNLQCYTTIQRSFHARLGKEAIRPLGRDKFLLVCLCPVKRGERPSV